MDLYAQVEEINRQVAEAQQCIEQETVYLLKRKREGKDLAETIVALYRFEMALEQRIQQRDRLLRELVAKRITQRYAGWNGRQLWRVSTRQ